MAYKLEEINLRTASDPKGLIEEADARYMKNIEDAADRIAENRSKSPIVLLSGPSGSGKTTTSMKISEALLKKGIQTHYVGLDDYYNTIKPETVPRTPEGEMDLESPYCLDIKLLNRHDIHLRRAVGKTIDVPLRDRNSIQVLFSLVDARVPGTIMHKHDSSHVETICLLLHS